MELARSLTFLLIGAIIFGIMPSLGGLLIVIGILVLFGAVLYEHCISNIVYIRPKERKPYL